MILSQGGFCNVILSWSCVGRSSCGDLKTAFFPLFFFFLSFLFFSSPPSLPPSFSLSSSSEERLSRSFRVLFSSMQPSSWRVSPLPFARSTRFSTLKSLRRLDKPWSASFRVSSPRGDKIISLWNSIEFRSACVSLSLIQLSIDKLVKDRMFLRKHVWIHL